MMMPTLSLNVVANFRPSCAEDVPFRATSTETLVESWPAGGKCSATIVQAGRESCMRDGAGGRSCVSLMRLVPMRACARLTSAGVSFSEATHTGTTYATAHLAEDHGHVLQSGGTSQRDPPLPPAVRWPRLPPGAVASRPCGASEKLKVSSCNDDPFRV
jgi:hypothetical protein